MDLDTLLQRFEREYLELNSVSDARRRAQFSLLRKLAASLDHPFTELTAAEVNGFIGAELADGLHPNTGRFHAGLIRSFLRWAESADVMTVTGQRQLVRNPRGSAARSAPKPYKPAEVAALRIAVAQRYPMAPHYGRYSHEMRLFTKGKVPYLRHALRRQAKRLQLEAQIALAVELGLRRTEIVHIQLDSIHPDNAHVVVRTAKQGPGAEVNRTVPFTSHARRAIGEWLDFRYIIGVEHDRPWLMLNMNGNKAAQIAPQTLAAFARALQPLDGEWEWHRLRHTAATEWLRAGMPIEKLRVMMGHASIEQTLAYAKIAEQDVEQAVLDAEEQFNSRLGLGAVA
jgi:site-specific recombinase XerD